MIGSSGPNPRSRARWDVPPRPHDDDRAATDDHATAPGAADDDRAGASGNGNGLMHTGTVEVHGPDPFDLDGDGDGVGCEDG